ncbi:hypothetical protein ACFVIM_34320, partial [Streptomyces sp. NPDC057638]|uniref:hypothetical protein n=1 Tax=Streptomyces sp. NPDC057638 TaxID=3346190 RepID=UPI003675837F
VAPAAAAPGPLATAPGPEATEPGQTVTATNEPAPVGGSPAPAKPEAVVTMGDGFLAGEGARWLGNARGLGNFGGIPQALRDATDRVKTTGLAVTEIYSADCRRSSALAFTHATARRINIACSGTGADELARSVGSGATQLQRLRALAASYTVTTVFLSVGAVDARYTETVRSCADAWNQNRYCSTDPAVTAPAAERIAAVGAKVTAAVQAVRAALREHDQATRVVVQSYPLPLASGEATTTAAHDENGWDRWSVYGCPFYDRDLRWLATGVGAALNTAVRTAAHGAGADVVDLGRLLDGHQVCGKDPLQTAFATDGTVSSPPPARAEWARYLPRTREPLPAGEERELLHPNYYGQRALGHCLSSVAAHLGASAAPLSARCVAAAGSAPEAVTVVYGE